jgi:hypothetical protein
MLETSFSKYFVGDCGNHWAGIFTDLLALPPRGRDLDNIVIAVNPKARVNSISRYESHKASACCVGGA